MLLNHFSFALNNISHGNINVSYGNHQSLSGDCHVQMLYQHLGYKVVKDFVNFQGFIIYLKMLDLHEKSKRNSINNINTNHPNCKIGDATLIWFSALPQLFQACLPAFFTTYIITHNTAEGNINFSLIFILFFRFKGSCLFCPIKKLSILSFTSCVYPFIRLLNFMYLLSSLYFQHSIP